MPSLGAIRCSYVSSAIRPRPLGLPNYASAGFRMKSVCDTPRSGVSDSIAKSARAKMRLRSAPL